MKCWGWILLLYLSLPASAAELEVIQLQNRSVEEVLPVLQPLLETGGTLTGMNDQLILRASDRNRAEIKKVLATLDRPARQLVIYVRQNMTQERQQRGINATGTVVLGNGVQVGTSGSVDESRSSKGISINAQDHQRNNQDAAEQMVRVMDGGSAYISAGVAVPIPLRSVYYSPAGTVISESTVYQELTSGFYATPKLMGDRVTLTVSPQQMTQVNNVYGTHAVQRVFTTVQTRLGEWVQIGGADTNANQQNRQILGINQRTDTTKRSVWLKIEAQ